MDYSKISKTYEQLHLHTCISVPGLFPYKAMLIKESVLRPEIFLIPSASQAKKHTQKKTTGQHKVELFMQWLFPYTLYQQENRKANNITDNINTYFANMYRE